MNELSYDDIAEWYDEFTRSEPWNDVVLMALLGLLPDIRGHSVLDLATGTGHAARELARRGARVIGIDVNETMLGIARRHDQERPLGIDYCNADARSLEPFGDSEFDGTMASLCLADIEDLEGVLCAAHRVLRSGGWFAWSIPHPCFTPPGAVFAKTEDGRPAKLLRGYFDEGFWRADNPNGVRRVGAFHRTLATYLNAIGASGLVLKGFTEPRVDASERRPIYAEMPAFFAGVAAKL